jgi:hypothetical protein
MTRNDSGQPPIIESIQVTRRNAPWQQPTHIDSPHRLRATANSRTKIKRNAPWQQPTHVTEPTQGNSQQSNYGPARTRPWQQPTHVRTGSSQGEGRSAGRQKHHPPQPKKKNPNDPSSLICYPYFVTLYNTNPNHNEGDEAASSR